MFIAIVFFETSPTSVMRFTSASNFSLASVFILNFENKALLGITFFISVDFGKPNITKPRLSDDQEAYKLKIVKSLNVLRSKADLTTRKEAVNVTFFLNLDNG